MTKQKALKKNVRARMAKTGERYTAARRQVTANGADDDWARRDLGQTDERIVAATGCDWITWIYVLDRWGARERTHTEIARHVASTYDVNGWWAQAVTVGYERARGMRAINERPDGYSVSVSKTIAVDEAAARSWFLDGRRRRRWLEPGTLTRRPGRSATSTRFDTVDGGLVIVAFDAKGPSKTTVSIEHMRLSDRDAVERWRAFWRERLATVAGLV
jgi:hypothetical protein